MRNKTIEFDLDDDERPTLQFHRPQNRPPQPRLTQPRSPKPRLPPPPRVERQRAAPQTAKRQTAKRQTAKRQAAKPQTAKPALAPEQLGDIWVRGPSGPFKIGFEQLMRQIECGSLNGASPIWRDGMKSWTPIAQVGPLVRLIVSAKRTRLEELREQSEAAARHAQRWQEEQQELPRPRTVPPPRHKTLPPKPPPRRQNTAPPTVPPLKSGATKPRRSTIPPPPPPPGTPTLLLTRTPPLGPGQTLRPWLAESPAAATTAPVPNAPATFPPGPSARNSESPGTEVQIGSVRPVALDTDPGILGSSSRRSRLRLWSAVALALPALGLFHPALRQAVTSAWLDPIEASQKAHSVALAQQKQEPTQPATQDPKSEAKSPNSEDTSAKDTSAKDTSAKDTSADDAASAGTVRQEDARPPKEALSPNDPPTLGKAFPLTLARRAMSQAAIQANLCAEKALPHGDGLAHLTFSPSGHVTEVKIVTPRFQTGRVGECASKKLLETAPIPAFDGPAITVKKTFFIPQKR